MRYITPEKHEELKKGHLKANDILITTRGEIGTLAFVTPEFDNANINAQIVRLQANPAKITPLFLFYLLNSRYIKNQFYRITTGSTLKQLSVQNLHLLEVQLPQLPFQKKIVERLDAVRKAQELCNQQIQKTEELFESLLNNVFNQQNRWEVKKLEEVTDVTSSKRVFQKDYVQAGVPFYRTKEIVELGQNKPITLELFISEEQFIDIANKFGIPKQGDILISAVGTIGISWIVPDNRKFYFKDGNLLWIKNFKEINSRYLKLFFDYSFSSVSKLAAGGAYKALTIINLKKFKIPVPSILEQQKIVEKLEAVQNYKKLLIKQKELLKELFESVLDKSMKGEMDN